MDDLTVQIEQQAERLSQAHNWLQIDTRRSELAAFEQAFAEPGFWDDQQKAAQQTKQAADIRTDLAEYDKAQALLDDSRVANELAVAENDEALAEEAAESLSQLTTRIDAMELASWFSGQFDGGDAIITVSPGQGGLEAQDWTDMLFNMYLHYAALRGWQVEVLDAPAAEGIGLDQATFIINGRNAFGILAGEKGVHRLVRISPTDAKGRRHTTFAAVEVLPVLPEDIEVIINPADLRIDVYRSSGPGGQSVNTTDSAVRITHLPTGLVVTCQNEKSQLQNKESAMKILRARLFDLEQARRQAEIDQLRGSKVEAAWGNQIRNYVLFPYQMVKDLRTGVETGNVDAVLKEGDLDQFTVAYLRAKASGSFKTSDGANLPED
ncbi:MAG: peptide chain release factor 2 [Coriobacteriales bacterium]|jgi:peptide chain release factor 2|nr:peptide chain release factor 2 [Coriobacteriales bacterium]